MSALRFAVVGTGAIARAYATAFAATKRAKIVAACDVRPAAVDEYARQVGCVGYTSLQDMVAGTKFDAAVVCVPPAFHEVVACELLRSKKHVLCEKPLAVNVRSALTMIATAAQHGTILTMASKFRYAADVRKCRELVVNGAIGELVFLENAFTSHVDMRQRWNSDAAVSGGGVLIDNGTHAVDILRYFLGNLYDIQVVEGRRMQDLDVEDTVRLFVHNEAGVMGASDLSWSIDKALETYLRVYGSCGTVLVGWQTSRFRRHGETEWRTFGNGYDKIQAFRDQIENFCDAIQGVAELIVTPGDGLASVRVIQAAYAALALARWERIDDEREAVRVETGTIGKAMVAS